MKLYHLKKLETLSVDVKEVSMEKLVGEGVKFERIRRVTGYLSGTVDRFNNAKRAEEKDRVKHTGVKEVMSCEKCCK